MQLFNDDRFGELRATEQNDESWFVAADVARSLEIKNVADALKRLDSDEKGIVSIYTPGGDQGVWCVSLPGLLSLILGSRKPKAHDYKRWVTHEVLPAIHKTGGYMAAKSDETTEEVMARAVLIAQDTINRMKAEQDALKADNDLMRPKAVFADAVAASSTTILVGELAKIIKQNGVDMGQNRLFEWLRQNGWLIKSGSQRNMPTQKAMEMGLFEIKETSITHSDGHITVNKTPKVTGKGQQYFVNLFIGQVA